MLFLAIVNLLCFWMFIEVIACAEHEPPWFGEGDQ
jgi:hypothetical protein